MVGKDRGGARAALRGKRRPRRQGCASVVRRGAPGALVGNERRPPPAWPYGIRHRHSSG